MKAMLFKNRADAGEQLADHLFEKYRENRILVLGIPRGRIQVACPIAIRFQAELSLLISKKLPLPGHPEFGFGAIAEESEYYVMNEARAFLDNTSIENIRQAQALIVDEYVELFRNGEDLPSMEGKTVILVDDGIATGVTLVPALRLCRKKGAQKVVIASPVSGKNFDSHLTEADAIEILYQPADFRAVGQYYEDFSQVETPDLLDMLERIKHNSSSC